MDAFTGFGDVQGPGPPAPRAKVSCWGLLRVSPPGFHHSCGKVQKIGPVALGMLFIGASSPDRNVRFSALGKTQPAAGVCSLEKKKKRITDQPEVAIDR
jgi:hypothetical protein